MKKWLLPALILLLVSGAAFADASNPSITSTAVSQKTDLSIAYLSSMFGSVTGVLNGTSGQMFGKLMYQFNQGLLVVAGCWLGFTGLGMVFRSAVSGSFMQQDNKVPMILLRIAFGFGLLIPNPSTGYTLLQGIVMQVVVQGVKLANQVWDYGLGYMESGGSLWSRPAKSYDGKSSGLVSDDDAKTILGDQSKLVSLGNPGELSLIQRIMAMEACMVQSSIDLEKEQGSGSNDFNSMAPQISINENLTKNRYEFPNGPQVGANPNVNCGSLAWNSIKKKQNMNCAAPTSDGEANDDNTDCGYSRLALREMIYGLYPAVKKYVCRNYSGADQTSVCSSSNGTSDDSYMTDALTGGLLNYINLIDPVARKDIGGNDATKKLGFTKQAKKEGWMMAGRYYWDLLRVEEAYNGSGKGVKYSDYTPTSSSFTGIFDANSYKDDSQANLLLGKTPSFISQVNTNVGNASTASAAGVTNTSLNVNGQAGSILMRLIPIVGELANLIKLFSITGTLGGVGMGPEPILWLHQLGTVCISIGGNLWLGTAIAIFLMMLPAKFCSSVNSLGSAMESMIKWVQPLFLAAAAAFFTIGIFLGFYMPIYPYMLFTFGVIGWIIIVIEAMVAAPMVAMGITHPENHDFLGRSQQAVMLLLSVFLRPALMVIGLFAAMILCQVSLSILIYTYSNFIGDIFYAVGPSTQPLAGDTLLKGAGLAIVNTYATSQGNVVTSLVYMIIVMPMFLAIFVMLVYTTTTNCFSLIHQLPDYIMSWIGVSGTQSHSMNAKEAAGEIKQGTTSGAEKTAKGIADEDKHARKTAKESGTVVNAPVQRQN